MPKRFFQVLLVFTIGIVLLGAGSPSNRFDKLGHQLMCQCSCGQILLECNHVGCPVSPVMINELHAQIDTNLHNTGVLSFFIAKYGPIVLAAPMRGGFDTVAWVVPFAVLLLGTLGVGLLLQLWRHRHPQTAPLPVASGNGPSDQLRARIRQETDYD